MDLFLASRSLSHFPASPFLSGFGRESSSKNPADLQDPVAEQGGDVIGAKQTFFVQKVDQLYGE